MTSSLTASQIVLLESDFSCMPSVVLEGRRVVSNNIDVPASLFLVKNIFSFLLAIFSMAFMLNYPLEPSQISLIGMFTIGIPAFLLAMEPNKKMIQEHFHQCIFESAPCRFDRCSLSWLSNCFRSRLRIEQ